MDVIFAWFPLSPSPGGMTWRGQVDASRFSACAQERDAELGEASDLQEKVSRQALCPRGYMSCPLKHNSKKSSRSRQFTC